MPRPDLLRGMDLPLILFWFESKQKRSLFVSPRPSNLDPVKGEDDRDWDVIRAQK